MKMSLKLGTLTAALTPFIWSVVVHSGVAPTPLSIANPDRPALAFRQYAVDLGPIQPTSEARGTFVFVNRGKSTVEIKDVAPSCSCLVPRIEKKLIEPNEVGHVVLRIQPANESAGPRELFADVEYNDPQPRQVRLTFKLVIPELQMTVTPQSLMFHHPKGSDPTTATFTVADGRKKPFDIVDVEVNSDLVTTTIGERAVAPTGEWSQTIQVTVAGELPEGRKQCLMRIRTSDLDYPELRVPLILSGPISATAEDDLDHEHPHPHAHPTRLHPEE